METTIVLLGFIWEFPKIRGTFLGVPIIRIIVYWGLYWGPLTFGKLPYWDNGKENGSYYLGFRV